VFHGVLLRQIGLIFANLFKTRKKNSWRIAFSHRGERLELKASLSWERLRKWLVILQSHLSWVCSIVSAMNAKILVPMAFFYSESSYEPLKCPIARQTYHNDHRHKVFLRCELPFEPSALSVGRKIQYTEKFFSLVRETFSLV
jgi:hypothetical protein